ncbi:hypothetical protein ACWCYY_39625 [Kitasatospora sp. NPDC001664]
MITSGTVLGAKPTHTPEEVTAILGPDFTESSVYADSMWHDYGLVEFFWHRQSPDHPWEGHHFTVQVHRLASGATGTVPTAISARYGRFDRHLRLHQLQRLLAHRRTVLEEVPDSNAPEYTLHWQPTSHVSLLTYRTRETWARRGRPARGDNRHLGDVQKISSSMTPEQVAWHRSRYGTAPDHPIDSAKPPTWMRS